MNAIKHKHIALYGAALCLLAVAIGAFGAHALSDILETNQRQSTFELANRYQFYHGLALLIIAALFQTFDTAIDLKVLSILIAVGTVIFSASLYLLAITNIGWFGAITPIGGTLMIVGWCLLIWKLLKTEPLYHMP